MKLRLVGGFNHREKYESQWKGLSHLLWKIKNVPNHQPVMKSHEIPIIFPSHLQGGAP